MKRFFILFLVHLPFLHLYIGNAFAQCSVEAGNNVSVCPGQITRLIGAVSGGTPTTYTWTSIPAGGLPSKDTITVSPTVTTSYIISVTGGGCNTSDTVTVNIIPPPTTPT